MKSAVSNIIINKAVRVCVLPFFDQCEEIMYIYVQNYTPVEEMLLKIECDHSLMGYGRQKICNF